MPMLETEEIPIQLYVDDGDTEGGELKAVVRFEYDKGYAPSFTDPYAGPEASTVSIRLLQDGKEVELPKWLEQRILSAHVFSQEALIRAVERDEVRYV
jgi:hypothetical protein